MEKYPKIIPSPPAYLELWPEETLGMARRHPSSYAECALGYEIGVFSFHKSLDLSLLYS